jgi:propanediol dehydratase small subunit
MKEYLIRLDIEPFYIIALAMNFEEASEIANRHYGQEHILQILQYIFPGDN